MTLGCWPGWVGVCVSEWVSEWVSVCVMYVCVVSMCVADCRVSVFWPRQRNNRHLIYNTNNLRYAGYAITTITFIPNTTIHVSVYKGNRWVCLCMPESVGACVRACLRACVCGVCVCLCVRVCVHVFEMTTYAIIFQYNNSYRKKVTFWTPEERWGQNHGFTNFFLKSSSASVHHLSISNSVQKIMKILRAVLLEKW